MSNNDNYKIVHGKRYDGKTLNGFIQAIVKHFSDASEEASWGEKINTVEITEDLNLYTIRKINQKEINENLIIREQEAKELLKSKTTFHKLFVPFVVKKEFCLAGEWYLKNELLTHAEFDLLTKLHSYNLDILAEYIKMIQVTKKEILFKEGRSDK